jgi:hypothetical protein
MLGKDLPLSYTPSPTIFLIGGLQTLLGAVTEALEPAWTQGQNPAMVVYTETRVTVYTETRLLPFHIQPWAHCGGGKWVVPTWLTLGS